MLKELGRLMAAHPWTVCAAWLAAGVLLAVAAPARPTQGLDQLASLPERCASVRGQRLLENAFGLGRSSPLAELSFRTPNAFYATSLAAGSMVLVVLGLVYRTPLLAALVVGTGAAAVWIALHVLAFVASVPDMQIVNEWPLLVVGLVIGVGAALGHMLVSRYRELLSEGQDAASAIADGIVSLAGTMVAGMSTLVAGLALLMFAEFAPVRHTGPALAGAAAIGLLAALTLLPALLRISGRIAFWPRPAPAAERSNLARRLNMREFRLWDSLGHAISQRPILAGSLALLAMTPFALHGLRVDGSGPSSWPEASSQITVLLRSPSSWTSREGCLELEQLSQAFALLPYVAEVHSMTQPGKRGAADFVTVLDDATAAAWWRGTAKSPQHITRLEMTLNCSADSPAAADTFADIKVWLEKELPRTTLLPGGVQSECCGGPAFAHDATVIAARDRVRGVVLALLAAFTILLVALNRPGLAAYVILSAGFCYFAAAGVLSPANGTIALLAFPIVLAVSAACSSHLALRALEAKKRYGMRDGIRQALAQTGGPITISGLVLAASLLAMLAGGDQAVAMLGTLAAVGILLVTFLQLPFAAPAFAMLFWNEPASKASRQTKRKRVEILAPLPSLPEASDDPEADDLYQWMLDPAHSPGRPACPQNGSPARLRGNPDR